MTDDQQTSKTASETSTPPCPTCGGEMWDNRVTKKNPRAPDFKCKSAGCEGVVWPPREAGAIPVAVPAGTADDPACPVCGGKMWDDRASKRNPRAPDFKCRNKPKAQDAPGCPGVIWPPREGERRPAATRDGPTHRSGASKPRTSAPVSQAPRRSAPPSAPPPVMVDREFSDDEAPGMEDDGLPF
jgi:hypothetical protein